jgi:hypothetical protein
VDWLSATQSAACGLGMTSDETMRTLNCCFCRAEVVAPNNLNDHAALAVCDACYALGGRVPWRPGPQPWQVRVDGQGRVSSANSRKEWLLRRFAPNATAATVYSSLLLLGAVGLVYGLINALINWTMRAAILVAVVIAIYGFWHEVFRRGQP